MGHPPPRTHAPEAWWVTLLRVIALVVYVTAPAWVTVLFLWLVATWWAS